MTTAPMNPLAGASGPGKYSVRSDKLTAPSAYYGEGVDTAQIKQGAPLATTPDVKAGPAPTGAGAPQGDVTPLFAPSQRPTEDVMAGNKLGPGPGPEVLGMKPQQESLSQILAKMLPYDTNGEIAALYEQAQSRGL